MTTSSPSHSQEASAWDVDALLKVYTYLMSISDYEDRVRFNDPDITLLVVGTDEDLYPLRHNHILAQCTPQSSAEWARLGNHIGSNSCLNRLELSYTQEDIDLDTFPRTKEDFQAFCDGLKHNRSIESLVLNDCDLFGTSLFNMLAPFLEGNKALRLLRIENREEDDYDITSGALCSISATLPRCKNIRDLEFVECDMESEGIQMLSSGIRECKALKSFRLEGVNAMKYRAGLDDEAIEHLVGALNGHPTLVELFLSRNYIGKCTSFALLASLLEDPESKLEVLSLQDNGIASSQAVMLAESLRENRSLHTLDLSRNRISSTGWFAFAALICAMSSIEKTHSSNHTLQSLGKLRRRDDFVTLGLMKDLEMNRHRDKNFVARQKIVEHYFRFDFQMRPFTTMELGILPFLLSWIGNDKDHGSRKEESQSYSAMFWLFKNSPWLTKKLKVAD